MLADACRLCLAVVSESDRFRCFGPTISSDSAAGTDAPLIKYTVAEVLIKHFWFELHSERDADAYVCVPCWSKVADFHRFYQSVLGLYQARWQPKHEHDTIANIDSKLEITITECTSHSNKDNDNGSLDVSDDGGDHDGYEDSFHQVNIKQEDSDEEDEVVRPVTPPKRGRGRPPKSKATTSADVKKQPKSEERKRPDKTSGSGGREHRKSPSSELSDEPIDSEIAKYFTLKCDLCSEPLANLTVARNHYQQSHKQRGYLTCQCGHRVTRVDKVRDHCAFHADPSPFKCEECHKIYVNAGRLATHRKYTHPTTETGEEQQPEAGAEVGPKKAAYNTLENRRRGDDLIRRYIPLFCGECGVTYDTFVEARKHHRLAHDQRGYLECCGKRFVKKGLAVQHCMWHENPRHMDCTICGRSFVNRYVLREHIVRSHTTNAPYSFACDLCDSSFQLSCELRRHKQKVHLPPSERKYECFSCHRRFVEMGRLRAHQRVVANPGPTHVCDVCAKGFKSKATYVHHYAVEHGTVSLKCQCPECGKWLKHPEALARHQKQHRSLPCTCELCGHVSPNMRALNSHRRLVHSVPTHKCLVCGKMFKMMMSLREHMAMHAGITDLYTCAYCPQTFRSNANMYKHRRQAHFAELEADRRAARIAEDERNLAAIRQNP